MGVIHGEVDRLLEHQARLPEAQQTMERIQASSSEVSKAVPEVPRVAEKAHIIRGKADNKGRSHAEGTAVKDCSLCPSSGFRSQYMLKRHCANVHFRQQILERVGTPNRCEPCGMDLKSEDAVIYHFGLTHKLVAKLLKANTSSKARKNAFKESTSNEKNKSCSKVAQSITSNNLNISDKLQMDVNQRLPEENNASYGNDSDSDESREENPSCSKCAKDFKSWHALYMHYAQAHFRHQILKRRGIGQCEECNFFMKHEHGVVWHYGVKHNLIEMFLQPEFHKPKDVSGDISMCGDMKKHRLESDQLTSELLELDTDGVDDMPVDEGEDLPFVISEPWTIEANELKTCLWTEGVEATLTKSLSGSNLVECASSSAPCSFAAPTPALNTAFTTATASSLILASSPAASASSAVPASSADPASSAAPASSPAASASSAAPASSPAPDSSTAPASSTSPALSLAPAPASSPPKNSSPGPRSSNKAASSSALDFAPHTASIAPIAYPASESATCPSSAPGLATYFSPGSPIAQDLSSKPASSPATVSSASLSQPSLPISGGSSRHLDACGHPSHFGPVRVAAFAQIATLRERLFDKEDGDSGDENDS
jgi:hypothetical protein